LLDPGSARPRLTIANQLKKWNGRLRISCIFLGKFFQRFFCYFCNRCRFLVKTCKKVIHSWIDFLTELCVTCFLKQVILIRLNFKFHSNSFSPVLELDFWLEILGIPVKLSAEMKQLEKYIKEIILSEINLLLHLGPHCTVAGPIFITNKFRIKRRSEINVSILSWFQAFWMWNGFFIMWLLIWPTKINEILKSTLL